jgi:predicted amino acid-binding ACT domain protein
MSEGDVLRALLTAVGMLIPLMGVVAWLSTKLQKLSSDVATLTREVASLKDVPREHSETREELRDEIRELGVRVEILERSIGRARRAPPAKKRVKG